ncbi:hypothetical protein Bhyg_08311 [Pseudolycoriella hygida]|uniref:Tyr recombinase domain-containing protein n=1 Tax=Pseudolycoriella hygida TaxID=35572 RepID=A0A9Q0N4J6_9DIPT|nr:hypothetical protein Bhyg_08311 [Pseudolycoriella hygida]
MTESDSDSDFDLDEEAEEIIQSLLPENSQEKYEKTYANLKEWCVNKKIEVVDERALLVYFSIELAEYMPSTTISIYSMLKATLNFKDNVDISKFNKLKAALKLKGRGYNSKKSRVLTIGEIYRFLREAPDNIYLAVKAALIVGVYGACRRKELCEMTIDNIKYIERGIQIDVPKVKTNVIRQFTIEEGGEKDVNMVEIFRKYAALRSPKTTTNRFFVRLSNGMCMNQPIGINTIASFQQKIDLFLQLSAPKEYTGHCFRRSSASLLADSGVNISIIKRHGGWKSDTVAEGYVVSSLNNKRRIACNHNGQKFVKSGEQSTVTSARMPVDVEPEELISDTAKDLSDSDNVLVPASVSHLVEPSNDRNVTIIAQTTESRVNVNKTSSNALTLPGISFSDLHNCSFTIYNK